MFMKASRLATLFCASLNPMRLLGAGSFLILSACVSDQLIELEADVDNLINIVSTEPVDAVSAVAWPELIAHARHSGPEFLQVNLATARSQIALDARKASRYPIISAVLRSGLSADGSEGLFSTSGSVGLGFNYDIADALLSFNEESITLTAELITVEKGLQYKQAETRLLDSYYSHASAILDLEEAQLTMQEFSCAREEKETEVVLGRAAPDALRVLQVQAEQHAATEQLFRDQVQITADRALSQAGYTHGGDVLSHLMGVPQASISSLTPDKCYVESGSLRRDQLLLDLSKQALRQAELSRFTQISALLPTQINTSAGLNLDFIINWIIPIIDQGTTRRKIASAQLDLLAIALSAREVRLKSEALFLQVRTELAGAQLGAARIATRPAIEVLPESASRIEICLSRLEVSKVQLERRRIALRLSQATARLATACGA